MITAVQNSLLILAFLVILSQTIYPNLILKIFSLLLLAYYMIVLYLNISKESIIFLGSLIILFLYLLRRLFQGIF